MSISVVGRRFLCSHVVQFFAKTCILGDIMAPLLNNIGNLIQMPSGCGEQNMLHFVPDIVVSNYLKATNRLTPEKSAKSNRYMELGN